MRLPIGSNPRDSFPIHGRVLSVRPRPARFVRTVAGLGASLLLLACGSGGESEPSTATAAPVFAVDSVAVGIGFDEPVSIEGEGASGRLVDSAEIDLEHGDENAPFARSVSATDEAGNRSSLRVEVDIREAEPTSGS